MRLCAALLVLLALPGCDLFSEREDSHQFANTSLGTPVPTEDGLYVRGNGRVLVISRDEVAHNTAVSDEVAALNGLTMTAEGLLGMGTVDVETGPFVVHRVGTDGSLGDRIFSWTAPPRSTTGEFIGDEAGGFWMVVVFRGGGGSLLRVRPDRSVIERDLPGYDAGNRSHRFKAAPGGGLFVVRNEEGQATVTHLGGEMQETWAASIPRDVDHWTWDPSPEGGVALFSIEDDATRSSLVLERLLPDGRLVDREVFYTSADATSPVLTALPDGGALVAWRGRNQTNATLSSVGQVRGDRLLWREPFAHLGLGGTVGALVVLPDGDAVGIGDATVPNGTGFRTDALVVYYDIR